MINDVKQTYLMAAIISALGFIAVTLSSGVQLMVYGMLTMCLVALLLAFKLQSMTIRRDAYAARNGNAYKK